MDLQKFTNHMDVQTLEIKAKQARSGRQLGALKPPVRDTNNVSAYNFAPHRLLLPTLVFTLLLITQPSPPSSLYLFTSCSLSRSATPLYHPPLLTPS
jgi:hypothetical protein